MAILLDFNAVVISAISVIPKTILDDGGIRHIALNMLLSYKKKFSQQYGELIICCDSKNTWRADYFPYYKLDRKKNREESHVDWEIIYKALNEIYNELVEFFPYKVIKVDKTEADDVIAVLANHITHNNVSDDLFGETEEVIIISSDKDFRQLHNNKVKQYSPKLKQIIVETDPNRYLIEHIIRGDKSDSIPNIKSQDDIFLTGKKQSGITAKFIDEICEKGIVPSEFKKNYDRNRKLIDLSLVPEQYSNSIVELYKSYKPASKIKLLPYMSNKGLRQLYDKASEF